MQIVNSFSCGESSADQAVILEEEYGPGNVLHILANTGNERNEALDFAQRFSSHHSLNLIWVEAVINGEGEGTTHRVVNHNSASRDNEPFIEMVKKYGIPNQAYPHCTRELKARPIRSYLREQFGNDYKIAIGIRRDEPNRYKENHDPRFFYPLWDRGIRKTDVNKFFESQPFRMPLHEHQGNCKTCWKKSDIKIAAIYKENPEYFQFPAMLEYKHGLDGYNEDGTPRKYFRKNRTTVDIIEMARRTTPFVDAYRRRQDLKLCADDYGGCGESCEPFQGEMFDEEGW